MKYAPRDFWLLLIPVLLSSLAGPARAAAEQPPHPNILVIITDEQQAGMMSCSGNKWVKTPSIDSLAENGVRFAKAYCTNPVCIPSRFSMFTGRMPSVIGMETNKEEKNPVPEAILTDAMGNIFRRAGYTTAYAGKVHLPGRPGQVGQIEQYGFQRLAPTDRDGREPAVEAGIRFLGEKHEKPFLLVTSLINPHDICYMSINAFMEHIGEKIAPAPSQDCLAAALQKPPGISDTEFFEKYCPPLPPNFEIPEQEPEAISFKGQKNFRAYTREHWTENDWRMHRWAYARLTELVDTQIGRLLEALKKAGLEENTLVVFTSDHGDNDAAHRLEHKDMPYEESIHVPFIISWKGITPAGKVDSEHLVSSGLDLIPTLCAFANIPVPSDLYGRSLRQLAEGKPVPDWRKSVAIEINNSRLLHLGGSKYVIFGTGANREQFVDLARDPGEMKNMAPLPDYKSQVGEGRKGLVEWYSKAGLTLDPKYIVTD